MITCCEIALFLSVTNIISLAVFAEYTIKLRTKHRLIKLEKKNGHEQDQINLLKQKIQQLEEKLKRYESKK